MTIRQIDPRRILGGAPGGGTGSIDVLYASRADAIAASPSVVYSTMWVSHSGKLLAYSRAPSGLTYPALVCADGSKWEPADIVTPLHFGAVGNGEAVSPTDDYDALQTMFNYLLPSTISIGEAYEKGRYRMVSGWGKRYATSRPLISGNIATASNKPAGFPTIPVGYLSYVVFDQLNLKLIQGTFNWATTFGGAENIQAAAIILAHQLDENATEGKAGVYNVDLSRVQIDTSNLGNGVYLQNTMKVTLRDMRIDFLKKNGEGIGTSIGNSNANPRGYKTINGALFIDSPNIKGYVEESIRHPGNANGNWPGSETQDSMNAKGLRIQTNDCRIAGMNVSRCRYALWMDNCGAIQIYDSHPWSQEIYVGFGAQRIWFDNIYFDYTRVTVMCNTTTKRVRFRNCMFALGPADRGPHLVTSLANYTGKGLVFAHCEFEGDADDINMYFETDGTSDAFWRGVLDREIDIYGRFGTEAAEAYFKVGKFFTVAGADGYSYFRRKEDGFGRTQVGGNFITLGYDRFSSGLAGIYFQWQGGTAPGTDGGVYVTAAGHLVLENKYTSGDIVFGIQNNWGVTRVKSDATMQIFGTSGVSTASTALKVGANGTRSISTKGTINASGADYAEYHEVIEPLWGKVPSGAMLGFNEAGLLTDRWTDIVGRVVIKSTQPNIVGADTWGEEQFLCERYGIEPVGEQPEPREVTPPAIPRATDIERPVTDVETEGEDHFLDRMERYQADIAKSETAYEAFENDLADARAEYDALYAAWQDRRSDMAEAFEIERARYDRIAKCGYVPLNMGASAEDVGKYVVPVEAQDGGIASMLVAADELTLGQYIRAIGCVIHIAPDGRPLVEVKVG